MIKDMSILSNLPVHLRSKGKHKKIFSVYRFLKFLPGYYLFKHKLKFNIIKSIFQNNKWRMEAACLFWIEIANTSASGI